MQTITFGDLRRATLAARQRTGDTALGTRVNAGLFQVVRVTYGGGRSAVQPMSEYLPAADAISFLNELAAS